jgi:allantoin racemase
LTWPAALWEGRIVGVGRRYDTRIQFIVPFPLGPDGVARRAVQVRHEILAVDTTVECVAVRNAPDSADSPYEMALFDMYIAEAGLRAEADGYDAVVMDTVGDSGLATLRSRLRIPVVGPGQTAFAIATLLGRRFSIVSYLEAHRFLYEKTLDTYHVADRCASIRPAGFAPDFDALVGADKEKLERLTEQARLAIEYDGADVIVLGSTTMHEAEEHMRAHLDVPIVNPGPVAIKLAETLVLLRLSQSKAAHRAPQTIRDDAWFSLASASAGTTAGSEPSSPSG